MFTILNSWPMMESMKHAVLAVDVGTSGVKAGAADLQGNIIASRRLDAPAQTGTAGRCEEAVYDSVKKLIRELVDEHSLCVEAAAVSGQMGGVVGIDRDFNSLTGFDAGLDTRAEGLNLQLHDLLGPRLHKSTCGSPRNTPKIMWWKEQHPEIYRRVHKFIPLNSYIMGRMTSLKAEDAVIDRSLTAFYGNEEAVGMRWSREITESLGLETDKFPRIASPFEKAGCVSGEFSRDTGIPAGIPVFVGTGDQSAGMLGAGVTREGITMEVSGSTTLLLSSVQDHVPDYSGRCMYIPSVFPDLLYACSYVNGAGIDLAWFHRMIAPDEPEQDFFSRMAELAASVPPGSCGLMFIPYFGGRHCPFQPNLRGGWLGISWDHSHEHLYRSILESVCYTHAEGLRAMNEMFHTVPDVLFTCGGGSQNSLWNQIKADVLNTAVQPVSSYLNTLRGIALTALHGLGEISDLRSTPLVLDESLKRYYPDMQSHQAYQPYDQLFSAMDDMRLEAVQNTLSRLREMK